MPSGCTQPLASDRLQNLKLNSPSRRLSSKRLAGPVRGVNSSAGDNAEIASGGSRHRASRGDHRLQHSRRSAPGFLRRFLMLKAPHISLTTSVATPITSHAFSPTARIVVLHRASSIGPKATTRQAPGRSEASSPIVRLRSGDVPCSPREGAWYSHVGDCHRRLQYGPARRCGRDT